MTLETYSNKEEPAAGFRNRIISRTVSQEPVDILVGVLWRPSVKTNTCYGIHVIHTHHRM